MTPFWQTVVGGGVGPLHPWKSASVCAAHQQHRTRPFRPESIESLGDKTVAAEDQAILDAYAAEVLSRALSASALRLSATDDNGPNVDG